MIRYLLSLIVLFVISGCLGGMVVKETHYFSVDAIDDSNTNYFRLNVRSNTILSKAEYNSGYYPKEAVDQLFGKVVVENDLEYMQLQRDLKTLSNENILKAEKAWYNGIENKAGHDELQNLLEDRTKVLAYPKMELALRVNPEAMIMEYNPALERVIRHIDQKQVFFLSANPDEIMQDISSFSQSAETALQLKQMADMVTRSNTEREMESIMAYKIDSLKLDIITKQLKSVRNSINSYSSHEQIMFELRDLIKVVTPN